MVDSINDLNLKIIVVLTNSVDADEIWVFTVCHKTNYGVNSIQNRRSVIPQTSTLTTAISFCIILKLTQVCSSVKCQKYCSEDGINLFKLVNVCTVPFQVSKGARMSYSINNMQFCIPYSTKYMQ